MANDLIKALIKVGSSLVATGFAIKVGAEGKKNVANWQKAKKQSNPAGTSK